MKSFFVFAFLVSVLCATAIATISIDNNDPTLENNNSGGNGWGANNNNNDNDDSSGGIHEHLKSIVKIPHTIIGFIKDSGLYILALPLLIIIPIIIFLISFKNFIRGFFEDHGWHRSLNENTLLGPRSKVKLDDKVVRRILKSV